MDNGRQRVGRAIVVLVVISILGFLLWQWKKPFVLGLDLAGGSALTYRIETKELVEGTDVEDSVNSLRDVIERRVNLFGVTEPSVTTNYSRLSNEWRLIIELPGVTNIDEAAKMIGETPVLDFRILKDPAVMVSTSGPQLSDFVETELTGRYLERSSLLFDPNTQRPIVSLKFDERGGELFAEMTKNHIGEQIAIFLDGAPISAPVVQQEITGGEAVITGQFSVEEARQLVGRLNSGALPVPITLIGTTLVPPSLGETAVDAGINSSILGFIIISLFMILWYRLSGIAAVIALVAYSIMMLGLFKLIPVTLTAAGLAGFIISLGLAVDANILVFERMKEELRSGKGLADAVEVGFSRAWTSIRDSHLAAIIVSIILFWFGTSVVKGFAFTFFLGAVISLISAQLITRVFMRALINKSQSKFVKFLFSSGFNIK